MASDEPAPEAFLLEFIARAKKRQAKLQETEQPAAKVYHAERIVTSNEDEASNDQIDDCDTTPLRPSQVKKAQEIAKRPPVTPVDNSYQESEHEEEVDEDDFEDDPNNGRPTQYVNRLSTNSIPETIEEEDETSLDDRLQNEGKRQSITSDQQSAMGNDDDPLDVSEYLDGPILYRDDKTEEPELEITETTSQNSEEEMTDRDDKEETQSNLKYSMSIYRKENKPKTATIPQAVHQQPASDTKPTNPDNKQIIKTYEDKIRDVTNVIRQTGRALDLCYEDPKRRGTHEHLEFEKLLLISSFRRLVYSNEIAKIRQMRRQHSEDGTTGTVKLSLIQLQLTNEFLQSLAEEKVLHCFLCLARCGPEIQCTELITSRDIRFSGKRKICFNEPLVFKNVPTNFQLIFEVYEMVDEYPKSKKDLQNFFAPLTPSKRSAKQAASMLTPSSTQKERRAAFKSIGILQIKLDQCQNVSFTLDHVPEPGSVDGIVYMDITLKSVHTAVKKGMLHVLTESNEYPNWIRRWFVLRDGQLIYWRHPEDETTSPPIGTIDLHRCICSQVVPCSPLEDLYRQNSLVLYTSRHVRPDDENNLLERLYKNTKIIKHQMAANSKDERNAWTEALNFSIDTIRRWKSNSVSVIDDAEIKQIMSAET